MKMGVSGTWKLIRVCYYQYLKKTHLLLQTHVPERLLFFPRGRANEEQGLLREKYCCYAFPSWGMKWGVKPFLYAEH